MKKQTRAGPKTFNLFGKNRRILATIRTKPQGLVAIPKLGLPHTPKLITPKLTARQAAQFAH